MKKRASWFILQLLILSLLCPTLMPGGQQKLYAQEAAKPLQVIAADGETIVIERIAYQVLQKMGYQMQVKTMGMHSAVLEANNGHADILLAQTEGLEKEYPNLVRVPTPIIRVLLQAYAKDNLLLNVKGWEDLADYRVSYCWQNLYTENITQVPAVDQIPVSDCDMVWEALLSGQADVAVVSNFGGNSRKVNKGLRNVGTVEEKDLYVYVNRRIAHIIPMFSQYLQEMEADGTLDKIRSGQAEPSEKKHVLHISSLSAEAKWEQDTIQGIKDEIGIRGDAVYYNFNLNSFRVEDVRASHDVVESAIRSTFLERAPDVIIVSDNAAFDFVTAKYHLLFRGVPVVFCSVDEFSIESLNGVSAYFTGHSETLSVNATVIEMLRLYPEVARIFVINDYTQTGLLWREKIEEAMYNQGVTAEIVYNDNVPRDTLLQTIHAYDEDTLILLGNYYTDANHVYVSEQDTQALITGAAQLPVFVLSDAYIGNGTFGGLLSVGYNQGVKAGRMARQILDGISVAAIPIVYASESINEWMFDAQVIAKFGVGSAELPDGSILVNKPRPLWESNSALVIGVWLFAIILLLGVTILVFLLMQQKQRIKKIIAKQRAEEREERMQQERSLQTAVERIGALVEKVPLAFAVVIENTVQEANEYCRLVLNVKQGMSVSRLYQNISFHDKISKQLESAVSLSGEIVRLTTQAGEAHRHHMSFVRTESGGKKGYIAFAIDIEELEKQKDYVTRSQQDLQKIIDALPTAMGIMDTDNFSLVYANRLFLSTYGYPEIGQAADVNLRGLAEQVFAQWQGDTIVFEHKTEYTIKKGVHIKMYADQIVFRGKNALVLMAQDVSAETRQAQMLVNAAEKEREANQLKSIFLANMSHEIRTPMNAIIGLSQLALMKSQTAENNDMFSKISSSAKNLLSIINDILDFSKIEAEKMDFVEDIFSLEETLTNTFLVATERLEDKKLEVLLDIAPDVPCHLYGDKTRLWQVLKNVVDNAVKYTPEGRIVLSISVVSQYKERIELLFRVKDTGIGMSAEQLSRLFSPFTQFSRNNSKKAGTGLGMSITKQLVDLMQGTVRVESEPQIGTEFFVTIPFKKVGDPKTIGEFAKETIQGQAGNIQKVLLVDDDEYSLKIMAALLSYAGIQSVCVSSAAEAMVKVLSQNESKFDLIILDYMLGDTNGIELAEQINKIAGNTKLLLVTAYLRRVVSEEKIKEAGVMDVIEKPFIVSTFLQKVCNVMPSSYAEDKNNENYSGARVLLCEDNEINQIVAEGLLESFGISPVIVADGTQALTKLESEAFDLILMDIVMPIMDGHETTIRIRQSTKAYKDTPIVAMTANVMADEVEQCRREGMNGHIEKPIDVDKFRKVLAEFLSKPHK